MAQSSTRLKNNHPSPRPSTSAKATADRSPGQAPPPALPAPERTEQPAYRMLPHNMEAEQGLLGALLVDNRAMERIGDFLRQDHFFIPAHKRIYAAIEKLIERGQSASPVTLKGFFEKDEGLAGVGGAQYLAELAASVITVINTEDYGRTIYDLHLRRELITDELPSGLSSLIHQNSAGNPLFMIATLDHLRTQHILLTEKGQVTLSLPLDAIELGIPDALSGVIELQLDRLTDHDRLLLEAGSIYGTIFPAWAAAAALDRDVEAVEESYAALVRRVRLLSIAGQDELPGGTRSAFYVFAHALYREVLYSRLPAARRAQWHLRIADRLRSMFAGQEANVAHEIAAHTEAGSAAR